MRVRFLTSAAVVSAGFLAMTWYVHGSQKDAAASEPFDGKFISLVKKSEPAFSTSLEKVTVKRMGNDFFLVGVAADDGHPDNWRKGLTVWLNISDISEITVFTTLDDLRKAVAAP